MTDKIRDENASQSVKVVTINSNDTPSQSSSLPYQSKKSLPKYPKIIILYFVFIIFEVFSGGGFRTVLMIYMKNFIHMDDSTATAVYHAYSTLTAFTPIIGAIIADAYLGPYRTIKYSLLIIILADIVLTVTSIKILKGSHLIGLVVTLLLKCVASGGIGPSLGTLGANQFVGDQKKYIEKYFSILYLCINIASSVSSIVLPMLRNDFKCYEEDCYPLAYAVATGVLIISFVIYMCGSPFYRKSIHDDETEFIKKENVITQTIKCVYSALRNRFKQRKCSVKHEHWLEYADEVYSKELVDSIKVLFRIIVVFLPLPVFWGVYEQQYSRWVLQAQQLNGITGSYTIKPDQLQSVNPILICILVPFFNFVVYPLFAKIGLLKRQLQRISLGMLFAILSFGIATILESQMQVKSLEYNPTNRIQIINLAPCQVSLSSVAENISIHLNEPNYLNNKPFYYSANQNNNETIFDLMSDCANQTNKRIRIDNLKLPKVLIIYTNDSNQNQLDYFVYSYDLNNQKVGFSEIRFLSVDLKSLNETIQLSLSNSIQTYRSKDLPINSISMNFTSSKYSQVDYSDYSLNIQEYNNISSKEPLLKSKILLETCARYTIILFQNKNKESLDYVLLTDIYPNGLHIGLQLVQIFTMAVAEILVSISGLTFSYEEAPASLKSMLQALWILTTSFGNIIVVIIAESRFVSNQVHEYLIFICLLAIATGLFFVAAYFYKYVEKPTENEDKNENKENDSEDIQKDMLTKENIN